MRGLTALGRKNEDADETPRALRHSPARTLAAARAVARARLEIIRAPRAPPPQSEGGRNLVRGLRGDQKVLRTPASTVRPGSGATSLRKETWLRASRSNRLFARTNASSPGRVPKR